MFFQKNKFLQGGLFAAILLSVFFFSCVKTDYDQPPVGGDGEDIPTNATIAQLKSIHEISGSYDTIQDDLVIGGVVVMDDRSGNYYKTIVIQDSTGGIEVKFSNGYLYNRYPVGRKIYIRCKGLMLSDYHDLVQLIGGKVEENGVPNAVGLTENQERTNIVRGFLGEAPAPRVVKVTELTQAMVSTLITVDGVEFADADTAQTWADALTQTSLNRTLENCGGSQLLVRTSGFANFATELTPKGKGAVTGVLGIYGNDYQLYIRDTRDVSMNGGRCGAITGLETLVPVSDVRSQYHGSTTSAASDIKIKGIVISDRVGNNVNNKNIYLQDASGGILVRFKEAHPFNLGDEVEVVISDQELLEYNELLEINNVPLGNAFLKSTNNTLAPRVATIAEINANFDAWESTLVKISNCSITPAGTLSGNKTVSDGSGTIVMFTNGSSTFSSTPVPANPVSLTAIVSDFNGKQILLRNAGDIQ